MPNWINFNINDSVKVKLTEVGKAELRRKNDELNLALGTNTDYYMPLEDAEGYSTWQLWRLMSDLGHLCIMGAEPPFETKIGIEAKDAQPESAG